MVMKYEKIDKNRVKLRSKPQARQIFDQSDLLGLADSLLTGQLQPIGVLSDYTLIWGERRLRAALLEEGNHASHRRRSSTRRSPNPSFYSCGRRRISRGRTSRITKSG